MRLSLGSSLLSLRAQELRQSPLQCGVCWGGADPSSPPPKAEGTLAFVCPLFVYTAAQFL